MENLGVPKPLRTGTGAIQQESFMLSRFSAPQTPGGKPCVCPVLQGFGAPRFSHSFADARRTPIPPAPDSFLAFGEGRVYEILLAVYYIKKIQSISSTLWVRCGKIAPKHSGDMSRTF